VREELRAKTSVKGNVLYLYFCRKPPQNLRKSDIRPIFVFEELTGQTQCQQIRTVGQHNNLTAKLLNVLKTVKTQLKSATLQRHNNIATLLSFG
jgi:hypothetical protein